MCGRNAATNFLAVSSLSAILEFFQVKGTEMGIHEHRIVDAVGVPEFFYTTIGKTEPAGGDCIRVYCCIERGEELIVQFTVVMPCASLIVAAELARQAAIDIHNKMQFAGMLTH